MNKTHQILTLLYSFKKNCVGYLLKKTNCTKESAENIFIEAVLDLKQNKSEEEILNLKDIKSYLIKVSYNHWKRFHYQEQKKSQSTENIHQYFYDYLIDKGYDEENIDNLHERLMQVVLGALSTLGEKCQQIIQYFFYQQKSMDEIAKIMQFNNAEVATSTKYRCMKELKEKSREIEKNSNL